MFHLPGLIALVVSGLSLVLSIVGIAIPYWLHYEKGGQSSKMGLWFFCFLEDCDKITDQGVDTTLKVTRALEILGASMLLVAMGAFLLKLLVMKTQGPLHILAAIFAALAGVMMIIGCILFGTRYEKDHFNKDVIDMELHAGFYLCIVAGVGSLVAAVLYLIDIDDGIKVVPCGGET